MAKSRLGALEGDVRNDGPTSRRNLYGRTSFRGRNSLCIPLTFLVLHLQRMFAGSPLAKEELSLRYGVGFYSNCTLDVSLNVLPALLKPLSRALPTAIVIYDAVIVGSRFRLVRVRSP